MAEPAAVHDAAVERQWEGASNRTSIQTVEQIVDDPWPQVLIDTVVEQIVDAPVLEFQDGVGGADCGYHSLSNQRGARGGISASGARPRAHRGADSGIPRRRSKRKLRWCFRLRFGERIVKRRFPGGAVVGSGQRVNFAVTLRSCLKQ